MSLSRWQRPDGFPSDDYFGAVTEAVKARGIYLGATPRRDAPWRYTLEIAKESFERGALGWVADRVLIGWMCDEDDEPTAPDDFAEFGWNWTVIQGNGTALFGFPRHLPRDADHRYGIPHLEDPDTVADIIQRVITAGR